MENVAALPSLDTLRQSLDAFAEALRPAIEAFRNFAEWLYGPHKAIGPKAQAQLGAVLRGRYHGQRKRLNALRRVRRLAAAGL